MFREDRRCVYGDPRFGFKLLIEQKIEWTREVEVVVMCHERVNDRTTLRDFFEEMTQELSCFAYRVISSRQDAAASFFKKIDVMMSCS